MEIPISKESATLQTIWVSRVEIPYTLKCYSVFQFHRFRRAKFAYDTSITAFSLFLIILSKKLQIWTHTVYFLRNFSIKKAAGDTHWGRQLDMST